MTDLRIMSGSENAGSFTAGRQHSPSLVRPPVGRRKPKSDRVGWRPRDSFRSSTLGNALPDTN